MSINQSSDKSDVNSSIYVAGTVTVTTTQTEAKVGASREANRQAVRIYNDSNSTIYFGPSGVTVSTGEPLFKEQAVELAFGDIGVYMIVNSGTASVRIQEIG